MKRMRAILCGVLAALMLAGCGGVERVACQSERPSPDMNLTQYTVVEAAYPVFPKEPVYGDYIDDNGRGGLGRLFRGAGSLSGGAAADGQGRERG